MKFERPDIVRPPSEWRSYFLPLTSGCSNNTCTFCNRWGEKLQMRELEEKEQKRIDKIFADRMHPDALGDHSSIESWEKSHGHGFWGSSANGYIYDKDNK